MCSRPGLFLALALVLSGACRDEAAPAPALPAKPVVAIQLANAGGVSTTPIDACACAPHLVVVTASDAGLEHALARAVAPELAASSALASARVLPGPGDAPPETILLVDSAGLVESLTGSTTRLDGELALRIVSVDALGGLARRLRGRLPRASFDWTARFAVTASVRAASPQLARERLAEALAPEIAREVAERVEEAQEDLPWAEDPAPLAGAGPSSVPEALDRDEITRLGGGADATGARETLYRVRGEQGRVPFSLDLMSDLQALGFRTLSRRSGGDGTVLAMRDERRHVMLALEGELEDEGPFRGFLVLNEAPEADRLEPRLDRIAAGEGSLPALLALRRDLGEPRFPALARTLRARRARLGLGPEALLALAEVERVSGEIDAARLSYRLASHAAFIAGRDPAAFPGSPALAANLGLEGEPEFASAAGPEGLEGNLSIEIPADGHVEVEIPTGESAFIVARGVDHGLLVIEPWKFSGWRFAARARVDGAWRDLGGGAETGGGAHVFNHALHWAAAPARDGRRRVAFASSAHAGTAERKSSLDGFWTR